MTIGIGGTQALGIDRGVRVLRWIFQRSGEHLLYQLGLDANAAYELRIESSTDAAHPRAEKFNDAISAFERMTVIERDLIGDGWTLESFESTRAARA